MKTFFCPKICFGGFLWGILWPWRNGDKSFPTAWWTVTVVLWLIAHWVLKSLEHDEVFKVLQAIVLLVPNIYMGLYGNRYLQEGRDYV